MVRVIIIYVSTTFILLQLVSILIEPLFLPKWVMTFVIVLLVIGFPIAVIFSWIFDITPSGIQITASSNQGKLGQRQVWYRNKDVLFYTFISVLLVVIGILVYPRIFDRQPTPSLPVRSV